MMLAGTAHNALAGEAGILESAELLIVLDAQQASAKRALASFALAHRLFARIRISAAASF